MNKHKRLNDNIVRGKLKADHRKMTYLSSELGVSYATVKKMLYHGHIPKPHTLQKLADLLGVSTDELLEPLVERSA